MKMLKSLLLGSAIGIAVVAGAHAADVPCGPKQVTMANIAQIQPFASEESGLFIDCAGIAVIPYEGVFDEGAGLGIRPLAILPSRQYAELVFWEKSWDKHAWRSIDRARSPAPRLADFNTLRRQYM